MASLSESRRPDREAGRRATDARAATRTERRAADAAARDGASLAAVATLGPGLSVRAPARAAAALLGVHGASLQWCPPDSRRALSESRRAGVAPARARRARLRPHGRTYSGGTPAREGRGCRSGTTGRRPAEDAGQAGWRRPDRAGGAGPSPGRRPRPQREGGTERSLLCRSPRPSRRRGDRRAPGRVLPASPSRNFTGGFECRRGGLGLDWHRNGDHHCVTTAAAMSLSCCPIAAIMIRVTTRNREAPCSAAARASARGPTKPGLRVRLRVRVAVGAWTAGTFCPAWRSAAARADLINNNIDYREPS